MPIITLNIKRQRTRVHGNRINTWKHTLPKQQSHIHIFSSITHIIQCKHPSHSHSLLLHSTTSSHKTQLRSPHFSKQLYDARKNSKEKVCNNIFLLQSYKLKHNRFTYLFTLAVACISLAVISNASAYP